MNTYAEIVPDSTRATARYMSVVGGDVIDIGRADADAVIAYYAKSRAIDLCNSAGSYLGRITPEGTFAADWRVHESIRIDARCKVTDAIMCGSELSVFDPATAA